MTAPFILVLAHHYDAEAQWLCTALGEQRQAAVLLWPEAIGVDYRITLSLSADGKRAGHIYFADSHAPTVHTQRASYAVNRLGYIQPLVWDRAAPVEKAYATSEINAFFSAFVRALRCPVSNPVRNGALWTASGFEAKLLAKFGRRGVRLHSLATSSSPGAPAALAGAHPMTIRRWLHFEGKIYAPAGQDCRYPELEQAVHEEVLEEMLELLAIEDRTSSQPLLAWVTRTPALSCYGPNLVTALIERAQVARP